MSRRPLFRTAVAAAALLFSGLVAALGSSPTPAGAAAPAGTVPAYWLVASDGGIFAFGGAGFFGSTGSMTLNKPVVGMAGTPDSQGYWEVASDGGIFTFGDAPFFGSTGSIALVKPVVGMARTPDGLGYWEVASDGGIFTYGDAGFFGSMGGRPLNQPIVGMTATPDGQGYWLVASDGGIFAFGDAPFFGSTGNIFLNQPIVSMTASPDGLGYWFTAADGGVFAYGDSKFYGSLGSVPQSRPIVSMASSADGKGYWFTNSNGAVNAFGDAIYWGSAPQILNKPIVAMTEAAGTGNFNGTSYPSGSYGYDISNFQCPSRGGSLPPSPHTVGVVEVVGASFGATNTCLSAEAAWAGGGLNLYVFLTFGNAATSGDAACKATATYQACNFGFNAALDAFTKAQKAGVNTSVGWWLDVETANWSASTAANGALVQGALDGLHFDNLNSVGIYSSPGVWTTIVGATYTPAVPYWAADWAQTAPGTLCKSIRTKYHSLPSGPMAMVQYSSPSFSFSSGGMSTTYDDDYAC